MAQYLLKILINPTDIDTNFGCQGIWKPLGKGEQTVNSFIRKKFRRSFMNGLNSEDFPIHFSVFKSIAKSADDREEQSFQFSIWVLLSI